MATSIDDNAADGKSGKSLGWLLIIRCTRNRLYQNYFNCRSVVYDELYVHGFCKEQQLPPME